MEDNGNSETPASIRHIIQRSRDFGIAFDRNEKNHPTLRKVFCYLNHALLVFFELCHLGNTLFRSTRDLSYFFPQLNEDGVTTMIIANAQLLFHHYQSLLDVSEFMETSFSNANKTITRRCTRLVDFIMTYIVAMIGIIQIIFFMEKMFVPLSDETVAQRAHILRNKHPERKSFVDWWVPFIDESESWYFETLNVLAVYQGVISLVSTTVSIPLLFVFVVHLGGQYEILCSYAEQIGAKHTDTNGKHIIYTNIEKNEFTYVDNDCREGASNSRIVVHYKRDRVVDNENKRHTEKIRKQKYELSYIKQLVMFHQKLSVFQSRVVEIYSSNIMITMCVNCATLILCLVQVSMGMATLSSTMRLLRFVSEMGGVLSSILLVCFASELYNKCHENLETAIYNSRWYLCSNPARRDLLVFLRQAQQANYLSFAKGTLVLSNILCSSIVNFAYNFMNFIRASFSPQLKP